MKRIFTVQKELPVLMLGLKRDLRSETDPNGIIYPQESYRIAQEVCHITMSIPLVVLPRFLFLCSKFIRYCRFDILGHLSYLSSNIAAVRCLTLRLL